MSPPKKARTLQQHHVGEGDDAPSPESGKHGEIPLSTLTPLLQAAGNCQDESQIRDLCQSFCVGIRHDGWLLACYLPHLKISDEQIPHVSFSGYDSAWITQYNARRYFEHDPVVKRGLTAYQPFDWSEVADTSPLAAELFAEAAQYGIRAGFSAPLRGPRAARGLINFSRAHLRPLPDASRTEIEAATLYFGTRLMESVVRVADQVAAELSGVAADMSEQEIRILAELSAGKPPGVIAADLNLSSAGVLKLLNRIQKKLGCSSTEQALARAAFLNLGA